ncbi:MAG: FtsX-like permease family protein [Actinomycetota bacterium]|nr:FtsX-like permease family protein [Actinomycetota bacterium]
MGSLSLWLKWSLRDLRSRWVQVVVISLIIALGVGAYSGLTSTTKWRKATADNGYDVLNMYDLRVQLADDSVVDAGSMLEVVAGADAGGVVAVAEERLQVPNQVATVTQDGDVVVRGVVIGVPLENDGPNVNSIHVDEGRDLDEGDRGQSTALIERNFALYYGLGPEGTLTLSGGRELAYVGHALTPEYFLVTSEGGGFFAQASFAAVFTSLETAGEIAGKPGSVNDLVLTLDTSADRDAFGAVLADAFASEIPDVGVTVTNTDDDAAYTLTYEDIEGDQQFFNILAFVILAGSAAAAVNLIARMVDQTRREMGIAMALGVRRRWIAMRPMLVGVQIAVLGVILGLITGWAIATAMGGFLDAYLPMPEWLTPTQWDAFLTAATIGLAIPIVAVSIPVWRAIRVAPVEAIRTGHLASRGGGMAPLVKRLHLPGDTFSQMPIRNVLRAPRRGLLTALGIGATIAVLVMLVAGIDSFVGAIVQGGDEATGGVPDRVIVEMDSVYPADDGPVGAVLASPSISDGEAMLRVGGEFDGDNDAFPAIVEFIDWDEGLFRPAIEQGDVPGETPAVVISPKAAADLDVGVGDIVSLRLPQRTGPLTYSLESMELPVSGIHGHPFRAIAYMATGHATVLGLEGLANVASVVPADGVEVGDLQAEFLEIGAVTSVQRADAMARLMEDLMAQFVGIFQLFQGIVLLLAVLIAFSAAAIAVDERRREHATMFSYGVRPRKIVRMLLVESATVGAVATILGIAGGLLLLQYFMAASADTMPDIALPIIVTPGTIVWAVFVGIVAVGLAPLLTAPRKLRKMDLPSTLRVME